MGALDTNEGSVFDDANSMWVPIPDTWASIEEWTSILMTLRSEQGVRNGGSSTDGEGLGFRV